MLETRTLIVRRISTSETNNVQTKPRRPCHNSRVSKPMERVAKLTQCSWPILLCLTKASPNIYAIKTLVGMVTQEVTETLWCDTDTTWHWPVCRTRGLPRLPCWGRTSWSPSASHSGAPQGSMFVCTGPGQWGRRTQRSGQPCHLQKPQIGFSYVTSGQKCYIKTDSEDKHQLYSNITTSWGHEQCVP